MLLCSVYDQRQSVLYVQVSQIFSLWFIPFYKAHVRLVTMLHLSRIWDANTNTNKYYIHKQEDHYQFNEFVKFIFPFGGDLVLAFWQIIVAFFCVVGAVLFAPITWLEQIVADRRALYQ